MGTPWTKVARANRQAKDETASSGNRKLPCVHLPILSLAVAEPVATVACQRAGEAIVPVLALVSPRAELA